MRKAHWVYFVLFVLSLCLSTPVWAGMVPEAGPPGTTVTLGGIDFGDFKSTEVNRVEFNGISALIQLWKSDMIMVKVPLAAKTGKVLVINEKKRIEVGEFSIRKVQITKLVPPKAEPGSVLVIEGANFGNTAGSRDPNTMFGVNQVLVNGVRAHIEKWRSDKIQVLIPANATSGEVVVRLASSDPLLDGSCCAPVDYAVSNPLRLELIPLIDFQPTHGPLGSKVVLSGQGFGKEKPVGHAIFFNGHPAIVADWSERLIVVHVPLNASSGPLILKQTNQERDLGRFTVVDSQVSDVSPLQGPIGTMVRIKGKHFGVYSESGSTAYFADFNIGKNAVEIGGVPGAIFRWQDDEINVWVPFSAQTGPITLKRGANIPKPDGSCCAKQDIIALEVGFFTVRTPKVTSYSPTSAGLDEVVTIKGSGFGGFLKLAEATRFSIYQEGHNWENYRLGEDVSRSEVLINGGAVQVLSWTNTEIKVRVPRRHVFGIGNAEGFVLDPTTGELVVRRGSWDLKESGECCRPKQWVTAVAGPFTILRRGLPDPDYFNDPNPREPGHYQFTD